MTNLVFAVIFCTTMEAGLSITGKYEKVCRPVTGQFATMEKCEAVRNQPHYKSIGLEHYTCMSKPVAVWSAPAAEGGEALKPPGGGYIFRKD